MCASGQNPSSADPGGEHETEALLLTCMDYRLIAEVSEYMNGRGLRHKYDHVILAGASLGALTDQYPGWREAFWQHLDISLQLHGIRKLIVMDHRDCGAYKAFLQKDFSADPAQETEVHARYMRELRDAVQGRFPGLETELLMMDLEGKVGTIR